MSSKGLKLENQNEFDNFYLDDPRLFGNWGFDHYGNNMNLLGDQDQFVGLNDIPSYPYPSMFTSNSTVPEICDIEEFIADDLSTWDFDLPAPAEQPHHITVANNTDQQVIPYEEPRANNVPLIDQGPSHGAMTIYNPGIVTNAVTRRNGRYKSSSLELEEIQKYFDMPITRAAKQLNVGLTVLKKRCRELNIMRWPHRKLKSLKSLIHNVKELGLSNDEVELLEEHRRWVEIAPETELTERTKKLRQACFKANYKKRRSLQQQQQQAAFA